MASYAAAIHRALGCEVNTRFGSRGQFDVLVDGKLVVRRKGGLLALITRRPWPTDAEVITAIAEAGN